MATFKAAGPKATLPADVTVVQTISSFSQSVDAQTQLHSTDPISQRLLRPRLTFLQRQNAATQGDSETLQRTENPGTHSSSSSTLE